MRGGVRYRCVYTTSEGWLQLGFNKSNGTASPIIISAWSVGSAMIRSREAFVHVPAGVSS